VFETEMEDNAVHGAPGGESPLHVPVLADSVVGLLRSLTPGLLSGWIVDATVGLGGHAERVLEALPACRLLGGDRASASASTSCRRATAS
jgi:16S rRNA (cytosine1402-N4)-methyltransferase